MFLFQEEFVASAELSKREFVAEKARAVILGQTDGPIMELPTGANRRPLKIPRRPEWSEDMTAMQVQQAENEAFLSWRRAIAR